MQDQNMEYLTLTKNNLKCQLDFCQFPYIDRYVSQTLSDIFDGPYL